MPDHQAVLDQPPLYQRLLLEQPLPLVFVLLVVGLILLMHGLRSSARRTVVVGSTLVVLAAGVWILATRVKTARERLVEQTISLVDRARLDRLTRFKEMFIAGAVLAGPDDTTWLQFEGIFSQLEAALKKHGLGKQVVREIHAGVDENGVGRSIFTVHTTIKMHEQPVRTQWRITWKIAPDGQWKLAKVQWLKFQGRRPIFRIWQ